MCLLGVGVGLSCLGLSPKFYKFFLVASLIQAKDVVVVHKIIGVSLYLNTKIVNLFKIDSNLK